LQKLSLVLIDVLVLTIYGSGAQAADWPKGADAEEYQIAFSELSAIWSTLMPKRPTILPATYAIGSRIMQCVNFTVLSKGLLRAQPTSVQFNPRSSILDGCRKRAGLIHLRRWRLPNCRI